MDQSSSSYPGNGSLPVEVRDRVLSTYEQSVALATEGRNDEAIAGCELILSMDPAFAPASKLLAKLSGASSGSAQTANLDAGSLAEARRALEARDFQRAIEISNAMLRADLTNQEAQDVGREAQERLEAGPFVEQFLTRAQNHIASGNFSGARTEIEKARALDRDHPRIAQIEARMPKSSPAPREPEPGPAIADFGASDSPFQFDFGSETGTSATDASFVLDEPADSRRTAQASDFGFSFEEDAAQSAVPSEASAPLPGEAQTFDFTTASVGTTSEDRAAIDDLLREGDTAFDEGSYAQATEIWSRIFLIDVTNSHASERIEKARRKQLELDTHVEEILANSIAAFEAKNFQSARSGFEQVLRLDGNQKTAREYLDRLPTEGGGEPDLSTLDFEPPPPMMEPEEDLYAAYGIPVDSSLGEEFSGAESDFKPIMPPDPSRTPAARTPATAAAKPVRRKGGVFLIVGALLLLAVAAWFAWSKFAGGDPDASSDQTTLIISRARALASNERYDQAIDLLSSVGADDPRHEEALALIAELRTKKSAAPTPIGGRPAAEVFQELVNQGRASFMEHDYLAAKAALEKANAIRPLDGEAAAIFQNSVQQVAKLDSAMVLFQEGKYTEAVGLLEGLMEQDPENQNIRQLLENAHFNLGATALREDRLADAIREFDAVLASNPNDDLARRSREIAERYNDQTKDLLFRIYVKYLPLR